jgi:pimeloyl-ACP methyl ester carboxylesterase
MVLAFAPCACAAETAGIPAGASRFRFPAPSTAKPDRTLRVYTYRPAGHGPDDPIVLVMHGASRNADDYRDRWIASAERYRLLIVAPRIDKRGFSWEEFRLGGIATNREAFPVPADGPEKATWTFTLMDRIFEHVRGVTRSRVQHYDFFGHSAGGQFAHRFAMFYPASLARFVIAANSGWYTFPTADARFPFGLAGFPDKPPLGPPDHAAMFAKRLVVMLGKDDTFRDSNLLTIPEAEAQGRHRLARGRAFIAAGRAVAAERGLPFRWQLLEVPGIGHSSRELVPPAAAWLYGS